MRQGAMPVIIEHGYNGFLADSEQEFEVPPDGSGLERSGRRTAVRSVEERFSAARMADGYIQALPAGHQAPQAGEAEPLANLLNADDPA